MVLFAVWFLVSGFLLFLPYLLDIEPVGLTRSSLLWGIFLLNQLFILLRVAASVGWIGSEVAYYAARIPVTPPHPTSENPSTPSPES